MPPTATSEAPARKQAPHENPGAWLISKGWKALGHPDWPQCLWLDPTKPLKEYTTQEPIMAPHWNGKDKWEMRQVQVPTGYGDASQPERIPGVRNVIHPAGHPIDTASAMMIQLERDQREAVK